MNKEIIKLKNLSIFAIILICILPIVFFIEDSSSRKSFIIIELLLFLPFFIYQYYLLIKHGLTYYLGKNKLLMICFLILEPIGPLRFYYAVRHLRRYFYSKGRYAYTKETYRVRLKSLLVNVFFDTPGAKNECKKVSIPIPESPVYRYLITGNEKIFQDYHDRVVRLKHPSYKYTLDKFNKLYKNIKKKGYNYNTSLIRVQGNLISNGLHRACILHHLFGPEFEVGVVFHKKFI